MIGRPLSPFCLATATLLSASCGVVRSGPEPAHQGPVEEVPALDAPVKGCGDFSAKALRGCVERERLQRDVEEIARPRPPGSPHHAAVRKRCEERLSELGYRVELHEYRGGVNVVGTKGGFSKPEEQVVVSAHYDHIDGCAGADDNASGVAAALETARVFAEARFDRSLLVACWDEGEDGQIGSTHYARAAKRRGDEVILALSFESVGFTSSEKDSQQIPDRFDELFPDQALAMLDNEFRGDFLTVVADIPAEDAARAVVAHSSGEGLTAHLLLVTEAVKAKQESLHRSDHSSFWDAGFPAMLLTDTASFRNPHHHCKDGADAPSTLDYAFLESATRAAVGSLSEVLQLR